MSRPTIIINELDAERIDRLLEKPEFASLPVADALNEELDRAQMCTPETMPHDVVTMNSRCEVPQPDHRRGAHPYAGLSGADDRQQHATVGAGTRGRGAAWTAHRRYYPLGTPSAVPQLTPEVLELLYQPEAAGDYLR